MASALWPPQGGGSGSGTVTSVALTDSTGLFTVSGSPVTTNGTLVLTSENTLVASEALFTDASGQVKSNAITGTGNVVMSASPTLTGTAGLASATVSGSLKSGNYHIEPGETDTGNSGTSKTIDWSANSQQLSTLTGNVTYAFSNPQLGGAYVLRVATGAGGFSMTWPGTVTWLNVGNVAPATDSAGGNMLVISFTYAGSIYWGSFAATYAA